MKILLVDDERLVRLCTENMLQELMGKSVQCLQAAGAAQAEDIVARCGAPDFGFVDYKMPKCNGIQLIQHLLPLCPQTTWVLLSGYDMGAEAESIEKAGIRYVLSKPASLEDLAGVLQKSGIGEVHAVW